MLHAMLPCFSTLFGTSIRIPSTFNVLGTYSVHFCGVIARAPPTSTPADLRTLEPHLSMKREMHVTMQKMASNK